MQSLQFSSHGNAEDLGIIHSYMVELSKLLYVNVLAYDYSGYGLGMKRTENVENNVEPRVRKPAMRISKLLLIISCYGLWGFTPFFCWRAGCKLSKFFTF